jgi:predicted permease
MNLKRNWVLIIVFLGGISAVIIGLYQLALVVDNNNNDKDIQSSLLAIFLIFAGYFFSMVSLLFLVKNKNDKTNL